MTECLDQSVEWRYKSPADRRGIRPQWGEKPWPTLLPLGIGKFEPRSRLRPNMKPTRCKPSGHIQCVVHGF